MLLSCWRRRMQLFTKSLRLQGSFQLLYAHLELCLVSRFSFSARYLHIHASLHLGALNSSVGALSGSITGHFVKHLVYQVDDRICRLRVCGLSTAGSRVQTVDWQSAAVDDWRRLNAHSPPTKQLVTVGCQLVNARWRTATSHVVVVDSGLPLKYA